MAGDLDTPGAIEMAHLTALFAPRAWYNLVPDTNHTVVTAGFGTYSSSGYVADNNYLTAARTADGSLVMAYAPVLGQFTVDMSKLSAPAVARWYDPSSGAYIPDQWLASYQFRHAQLHAARKQRGRGWRLGAGAGDFSTANANSARACPAKLCDTANIAIPGFRCVSICANPG